LCYIWKIVLERSNWNTTQLYIIYGKLHWKDPIGILLNCILEDETYHLITQHHDGLRGGHFAWRITIYKIIRSGFCWPNLFTQVNKKVIVCTNCQLFSGKKKFGSLPLKQIKVDAPFQQWGLEFIGEIHPPSSGQHRWILIATNYFTKWIEAIPVKNVATDSTVIKFLEENILSRFGCHGKISIDNKKAFSSARVIKIFKCLLLF
jgi:hypothetical protein